MRGSRNPNRSILARTILTVAVLLGQFSGGNGCCCWVRYCFGANDSLSAGEFRADAGPKIRCPKCLSKLKKGRAVQEQLGGSLCQCSEHASIAIGTDPEVETRLRVRFIEPVLFLSASDSQITRANTGSMTPMLQPPDWKHGDWHARACIWRI